MRESYFAQNLAWIKSQIDAGVTYGVNQFADWSEAEFNLILSRVPLQRVNSSKEVVQAVADGGLEPIDLRLSLNPIRD